MQFSSAKMWSTFFICFFYFLCIFSCVRAVCARVPHVTRSHCSIKYNNFLLCLFFSFLGCCARYNVVRTYIETVRERERRKFSSVSHERACILHRTAQKPNNQTKRELRKRNNNNKNREMRKNHFSPFLNCNELYRKWIVWRWLNQVKNDDDDDVFR